MRGGTKRAEALAKLEIRSVQDLLQHYPRRHIDRTRLRTVADLRAAAERGEAAGEIAVHSRVQEMGKPFALRTKTAKGKPRRMIKGRIGDETGSIEVTWFNQDWVARALTTGTEAFFYGRIGVFRGKLQFLQQP